jgi:SAM-dependent methyltransferase
MDTAYADFAPPELTFDDWWMATPEAMRMWMATEAPKEEEFQLGVARRFVLPLLAKLGYAPGQAALLSAACGLGADVDFFNDAGYAAWGIDCGNRIHRWPERQYRDRLARGDLFQMPFPDGSFDFVMCLNVLEHIGVVGDTTQVTPDYEEQRREALRSLLRVTKPGGYVLLSGVNRRFPLDFFHTQEVRYVRIHSPFEGFSLSYGDQERLSLATSLADWTRPLPLRGFFSYLNLRRYRLLRPLLPALDWLLGGLPAEVYGSWLSFFTIVLVHRRADPPEHAIAARSGAAVGAEHGAGTGLRGRGER